MDFYTSLAEEDFAKAKFGGETIFKNKNFLLKKFSIKNSTDSSSTRRDVGDYYIISYDRKKLGIKRFENALSSKICDVLKGLVDLSRPLIVGLGNQNVVADSLGSQTIDKLSSTRKNNTLLKPSVYGLTGIESASMVKAVALSARPSAVITVDTLGCISPDKLFSTVQITTAGITPGEAVGNKRQKIDKNLLGIDVISVGIPLISYTQEDDIWVTPKEIDVIVERTSKILADGIKKSCSNKRSFG